MIEATPVQPTKSPAPVSLDSSSQSPQTAERKLARILFIHPGPVPPSVDPRKNRLYHLSRYFEGDLLTTRWRVEEDDQRPPAPVRYDDRLGVFRYHAVHYSTLPELLSMVWNLVYYFGQGLKLARTGARYDVVVSYSPYTTSLAAWLVSRLTGAKLVIDMPGHPFESYSFYPGLLPKIKKRVARVMVPVLLKRADMVKILYPGQLDDLRGHTFPRVAVFPDFVPVSTMRHTSQRLPVPAEGNRYILFLGFPWHLKGVDILIQAFQKIADKHPDVTLRVVGHCPDREPFEKLAAGHPRISLEKAVMPDEAIALMAGCEIFVLPSRIEGFPRVLQEAMAVGKPFIASKVGGIPTFVKDGKSGLLFDTDDAEQLAEKMSLLLNDRTYAAELADEGHRRVFELWSEERYVENFRDMIVRLIGTDARTTQKH